MKANEIRQLFLSYFKRKEHKILQSASLIPVKDPTLLLINAGMAPFKPYFKGEAKPPAPRLSTCQKCVRVIDIDRVGDTQRHLTFFEMLGNFSFGDYFKEKAIVFAWQFLTEVVNLKKDILSVSVFKEDDEAAKLWKKETGIPDSKIFRMGEEDNFWSGGPTGPCGPCSEIYADLGEKFGCGKPDCAPGCDCDRFLEVWNLVFMQYNRDEDGHLTPLPQKNIDTGMGLERLSMILQKKQSTFHTDLFFPVIEKLQLISGKRFQDEVKSFRILSDHMRSSVFLISDGVIPANDGRGYVLRRLIRRAVLYGKKLGLQEPFLHALAPVVSGMMKQPYPEIAERESYIVSLLETEERRFEETLGQGMGVLEGELARLEAENKKDVPSEVLFKLYDTYGFPLELTKEVAKERGFAFLEEGFHKLLEEQRERGRKAQKVVTEEEKSVYEKLSRKYKTEFYGHDFSHVQKGMEAKILVLVVNGEEKNEVSEGAECEVILDKTLCYPEGGGQVGDTGWIQKLDVYDSKDINALPQFHADTQKIRISDTQKPFGDFIVHRGKVEKGKFTAGDSISLSVEYSRRLFIARHHTATHLLHAALRKVLGEQVKQSGSLVEKDRLRFDFSFFRSLTPEELREIERLANEKILENLSVEKAVMPLDRALSSGAVALFDEKYGERVRVIKVSDFSAELCGGTHVDSTGDIGLCKIISEESIGSGLRRLVACCGLAALSQFNSSQQLLSDLQFLLKSPSSELPDRVDKLMKTIGEKEEEIESLRKKLLQKEIHDLLKEGKDVNGTVMIVSHRKDLSMDELRMLGDFLKKETQSYAILLASSKAAKVSFLGMTTKELAARGVNMGLVLKEISKITEGSGGGRPEMAQGGGKNTQKLQDALKRGEELIVRLLAV